MNCASNWLDVSTLQQILDVDTLLAEDPWGLESIGLRNIYTAPLNLLQIELLRRTGPMKTKA